MNEKYRKAFVTAHVVLRTARRHVPADVLNRGSHLPEILKMAPNIGGGDTSVYGTAIELLSTLWCTIFGENDT